MFSKVVQQEVDEEGRWKKGKTISNMKRSI